MSHQSRNRNAPNLLQGKVEDHELGYVRQLNDDPVQRRKTGAEKMQGQVARQAVEFGIRDRPVPVDQGDALRVALENDLEFLRERLVSPISPLTIALGELRRKRNDPF